MIIQRLKMNVIGNGYLLNARLSLGVIILLLYCNIVYAESEHELSTDLSNEGVDQHFILAPYLWLTNLEGNIGIAGIDVPVEYSSSELLSGVEAGIMGYGRWQRGNKFVFLEGIVMEYSEPAATQFFNQSVDSSLHFLEAGAGIQFMLSEKAGRGVTLSPYLGIRWLKIDALASGGLGTLGASDTWVESVLGGILDVSLNEKWSVISRASYTGIGSSQSEFKSVLSMFDYKMTRNFSITFGYSWADGKYEKPQGLDIDLTGHGPLVGFTYTFSK